MADTPVRTFRCPDRLWRKVQRTATATGTTPARLVVLLLEQAFEGRTITAATLRTVIQAKR